MLAPAGCCCWTGELTEVLVEKNRKDETHETHALGYTFKAGS